MFRIAVAVVLALSVVAFGEDSRIWRIEVQGTYEGIDGDRVRIKTSQGKVLLLNIASLCDEDKQFIRQKIGLRSEGKPSRKPQAAKPQAARPQATEPQATEPKAYTWRLVTDKSFTGRMVTFGEDKFSIMRRAGKVYVARMVNEKPITSAYGNLKGYDKAVVDYALKAKGLGTVDEYTKNLGLKAGMVKYPTVTIATGAEAEQVHPIHMLVDKQAEAVRRVHAKWLAEQPPEPPAQDDSTPDLRSFINRSK